MSENLRSDIVLSVNRALLGEVFSELVAVSCKVENERRFELTFFVDSEVSDALSEDISCIETEIIADFPVGFEISHKVVRAKRASLLTPDAFWIFLSKA